MKSINTYIKYYVSSYIKELLDYYRDNEVRGYINSFYGYTIDQYILFLEFMLKNYKHQDILFEPLYLEYIKYVKRRKKENLVDINGFVKFLLASRFHIFTYFDDEYKPNKVVSFNNKDI